MSRTARISSVPTHDLQGPAQHEQDVSCPHAGRGGSVWTGGTGRCGCGCGYVFKVQARRKPYPQDTEPRQSATASTAPSFLSMSIPPSLLSLNGNSEVVRDHEMRRAMKANVVDKMAVTPRLDLWGPLEHYPFFIGLLSMRCASHRYLSTV